MAEKDSKQKNNGKKSQQKDDSKQRGTREESSQQKNQILNPPGPRSMGNAGQWMDNQLTKLRQKFGKIVGDLTAENKFERPKPAPIDHEALSAEHDPLGIKRALVIKEHEIYLKKLDEDEDKYAQMYSILWGAMSNASQQLVKGEADFAQVERRCDVFGLVKLIKTTHLCVDNFSQPVIKRGTLLEFFYTDLRQFRNESLADFRTRIELVADSFDSAGMTEKKPDDEELAWLFIKKLNDHKYPAIAEDTQYNINMDVIKAPRNLDEAVEYVHKWERSNNAYAYKSNKIQQSANATMFATGGRTGGRGRGGRGGGGSKGGQDKPKLTPEEKAEKLKSVECYNCHKKGHYSSKCPEKKKKKDGDNPSKQVEEVQTYVTLTNTGQTDNESVMFMTTVNPSIVLPAIGSKKLRDDEILLDNEAQVSVIKNKSLLKNIRTSKSKLTVSGAVGDKIVTTDQIGDFGDFGEVYYHPKVRANILSFSLVRERCLIDYDYDRNVFIVTSKSGGAKYEFHDRQRLYTCYMGTNCNDRNSYNSVHAMTVDENEKRFPKHLVKKAREARRISECLGHESDSTMWKLLHSGTYLNMGITPDDVRRAREIYGPSIPLLKGTGTKKKPEHLRLPFQVEYNAAKKQVLHIDILFVAAQPYLLSVSKPLNLTACKRLSSKNTRNVRDALLTTIDAYKMHDYVVVGVSFDNEAVLHAAVSNIPGVTPSPTGSGMHEKVAESKARRLKERIRAILHSIPFELPIIFLEHLIHFVVRLRNSIPVDGSGSALTPREMFTGVKLDRKIDIRLPFGTYVQTAEPETDRSMKMRTRGAISLYSVGNNEGSVKFFDLTTKRIISRTSWTEIPMPKEVIDYINSLSSVDDGTRVPRNPDFMIGNRLLQDEEPDNANICEPQSMGRQVNEPLPGNRDEENVRETLMDINQDTRDSPEENSIATEVEQTAVSSIIEPISESVCDSNDTVKSQTHASVQESIEDIQESIDDIQESADDDSSDEQEPSSQDEDETTSQSLSRFGRKRVGPKNYKVFSGTQDRSKKKSALKKEVNAMLANQQEQASEFIFNLTIAEGIQLHGAVAENSIKSELKSIVEKGTFLPVKLSKRDLINLKGKIITCRMFLKEKFNANHVFEKLKSRLVAGGHRQDRSLYPDTSSPTPQVSNLFTIAAIAASENRAVTTLDIGNAYLNASMEGVPVYMTIRRDVADYLVQVDQRFAEFRNDRHEIIVKLKKALYGCIQSSKLWFNHIRDTLKKFGFESNPSDQCVFNMMTQSGKQCTVVVYVDDLLITCQDEVMLDRLEKYLTKVYKKVTSRHGKIHSYLGMNFNFSQGSIVNINMPGYIQELLKEYGVQKVASTPSNNNLFQDTLPDILDQEYQQKMHSLTARLLYIGTRTRPEILLVVNYLATRVNNYSQGDWEKAMRCLQYLNLDTDLGLSLSIGEKIEVHLYADASYGVHADGKSHSASVIKIGRASVSAKSTKQKIVTKSTTEAELVCASDMVSSAIGKRDFLSGQGYLNVPIYLHQDNKSTIKMLNTGESKSERTRHVKVRYFFMKEQIDNGEIVIKHTSTHDMIADVLTKPLQGQLFTRLRSLLLSH